MIQYKKEECKECINAENWRYFFPCIIINSDNYPLLTLSSERNNSTGSEIGILFLTSCSPQKSNLYKDARFQSGINTIHARQISSSNPNILWSLFTLTHNLLYFIFLHHTREVIITQNIMLYPLF